jgi:hypothetical protein
MSGMGIPQAQAQILAKTKKIYSTVAGPSENGSLYPIILSEVELNENHYLISKSTNYLFYLYINQNTLDPSKVYEVIISVSTVGSADVGKLKFYPTTSQYSEGNLNMPLIIEMWNQKITNPGVGTLNVRIYEITDNKQYIFREGYDMPVIVY